jgi:hypothetical protein
VVRPVPNSLRVGIDLLGDSKWDNEAANDHPLCRTISRGWEIAPCGEVVVIAFHDGFAARNEQPIDFSRCHVNGRRLQSYSHLKQGLPSRLRRLYSSYHHVTEREGAAQNLIFRSMNSLAARLSKCSSPSITPTPGAGG